VRSMIGTEWAQWRAGCREEVTSALGEPLKEDSEPAVTKELAPESDDADREGLGAGARALPSMSFC